MVFSSPLFLFAFLPAVLLLHFVAPRSWRNSILLAASLLFYAWGEIFHTWVMLASIAMNHVFGLAAAGGRESAAAKRAVAAAVVCNLALLGWFKYANFFADNLSALLVAAGREPIALDPVHLPIGVSFFTFQALSYVIDVYRGEAVVRRNPLDTALYVSLFPQLIAGPIVRFHDVATQIASRTISTDDFAYGVRRFSVGMAKKVLVANVVSLPADAIFGADPASLTPALAWLGVACYTLQIYFDFAGYSDMAIGLGRIFGFRFLENFDYPYAANSMTEFWRRWHMSLSTWFRDYLYIPLGGNRLGPVRTYRNLVVVFLLCGFWHGAAWPFVVWGAYHGLFLAVERAAKFRVRIDASPVVRHAYTLLAVMVGWVFFRAETLTGALGFLRAMAGAAPTLPATLALEDFLHAKLLLAAAAGAVGSTPLLRRSVEFRERFRDRLPGVAGATVETGVEAFVSVAALAMLALSAMELASSTHNPFIYFRF